MPLVNEAFNWLFNYVIHFIHFCRHGPPAAVFAFDLFNHMFIFSGYFVDILLFGWCSSVAISLTWVLYKEKFFFFHNLLWLPFSFLLLLLLLAPSSPSPSPNYCAAPHSCAMRKDQVYRGRLSGSPWLVL